MDKIYLSLETKEFEKMKKEGIKNSLADNETGEMCWPELDFDTDGFEFLNGKMVLSGKLKDPLSNNSGFISIDIATGLDFAIDVIEFYMKKLGKLKTVLEATK